MIAMIRLKKEIDLMPMHQRKQDFVDRKLVNLRKLPIEDQREQLISEQEDILISLNLIDEYIMSFIKKMLKQKILYLKLDSTDPERMSFEHIKCYKFWWEKNLKFS